MVAFYLIIHEIIHETKASLRIPNNIVIKNIIPIKSECSSANIFLTPISSTTSIITSAGTTIFTIVTAATSSVTGTPTIFLQTSPSSKFDTKPIIYDTSNIPLSANILPVTMTPIITTSIAVTTSTTITTLTPAIATMTSMITPTTKSTILSTAAALNVTTASTTVLSQSQPPPPSLLSSTQQLQSTSMGIITKSHPRIKYSGIKGGCTEKIEELLPTTHITTSTIPFTTTSIQQPQLITLQSSYTQQALLPPSTFLPTQLQSLVFSSTALKPFVTLTGDGILSHQQTTDNNNIIVPIILPNTKNNVPMSNISVIPSNVTNTSARHHHVQHIQTIQSTTGAPVTNASSIISVPIGVSQQQQQQQQQSSPVIVTDFGSIKYADIDDIELPDGTKIGYPTKLETKCIQPLSTSQDSPIIQLHHHHQQQQESPHPHSLIQIQHDTTGTSGGGIVYTSLAEKYSIIAASALKNFDFTLAETTIKDNTNSNCSSNSNTSAISNNPIKIITSTSTSITTTTSTTTFNNTRSTNTTTATTTTTTTTTTTNSTSGGNNDILIDTTDDPTELYACSYCDKKYRWKSTLRRHENDECGGKEPAHQCPYCPYKAKQRGNLGVHVRKHHGDMPQLESKRKKRGSSI